jgi:hypothetical protein
MEPVQANSARPHIKAMGFARNAAGVGRRASIMATQSVLSLVVPLSVRKPEYCDRQAPRDPSDRRFAATTRDGTFIEFPGVMKFLDASRNAPM